MIALRDEVRAALADVETRLRADERAGAGLTPDQIRSAAEQHLDAWCAHDVKRRLSEARQPLSRGEEHALRRSVIDRLFGLGELQPLLDDPDTETIVVNGPDRVFLHRSDGTRRLLEHPIADSSEELIRLIQRLAAREGLAERPWDSAHPALDLTLRDGSRLHAVRDVVRAPAVTIRRHRLMRLNLDDLVRMRTLHPADRELVEAAILAQQTVMVCGGPAAGKSTTLRGLATAIPPERRIVSIEATLELHLDDDVEAHPDCVAMQTRAANLEGRGELSSRDLFREALRMSPDVLIVGEVRGPQEALPMLMSVAAGGTAGSLSTIHARSSAHALAMLQTYVLMGAERLPFEASAPLGWGECCVLITLERRRAANGWLTLQAAGPRAADVRVALDEIRPLLPDSPPEDDLVAVRFWMGRADEGTSMVERRLAAPRWHEIAANYPSKTRGELAAAMSDMDALARRGRVLLWHGSPGTGKTYAVRALAREHAAVATLDCILEPDLFFGQGASHLMEVLEGRHQPEDDRWRILVLEDADELISADAKLRSGQGMSRLLNLADGLLGQALRVLVVITTNEPITGFHPAVVRPGRCGSLVGFQRFSPPEAREWLEREGNLETVDAPATLAQLFAMTAGLPTRPSEHEVGFRISPESPP